MARASSVEREAKAQVVRRLRMQRTVEKDLQKQIDSYRAGIASDMAAQKASRKAGRAATGKAATGKPATGKGRRAAAKPAAKAAMSVVPRAPQPTILAEGDSWFRYVVGFAVIWHLEKKLGVPILNMATPGDETADMLADAQRVRLRRELKRGPAPRRRYDYLLFSGGGNDIVGNDRLKKWLNDYTPGMTAKQVINKARFETALDMVEINYRELIALRDAHSPSTHLVLHAYDFAVPNGTQVCGLGPWLKPSLVERKVPPELRQPVVTELLKRFLERLQNLAAGAANISVVATQGTLTEKDWDNEMHPTKEGFSLIADRFVAHLGALDTAQASAAPAKRAARRAPARAGTRVAKGAVKGAAKGVAKAAPRKIARRAATRSAARAGR